ncbi:MAG: NUDIX domain-containing protein [Oscillospiraceae bacterium]|nr:NUDIX domain-containing protein [Oscillospiraceae bacterium]
MSSDKEEKIFLENYDPYDYTPMAVTVDLVVFGITRTISDNYRKPDSQELNILLIKRDMMPYKDCYSLPGGFVRPDETFIETARRILREKTGLDNIYLEQLYTFDAVNRDPRMRVVSCAYISLIDADKAKIDNACWAGIAEAEKCNLAFDHNNILDQALMRLKNKITYSDIVFNMMPEKFTISALQEVYEIILGVKLIPAAFRRTIAEKIEQTGEYEKNSGHRPSMLYTKKHI